jgi:hypothetical protein
MDEDTKYVSPVKQKARWFSFLSSAFNTNISPVVASVFILFVIGLLTTTVIFSAMNINGDNFNPILTTATPALYNAYNATPQTVPPVSTQTVAGQDQGSGTVTYSPIAITEATNNSLNITATPLSYDNNAGKWTYQIYWSRKAQEQGSLYITLKSPQAPVLLKVDPASPTGTQTTILSPSTAYSFEFYSQPGGKGSLLAQKSFATLNSPKSSIPPSSPKSVISPDGKGSLKPAILNSPESVIPPSGGLNLLVINNCPFVVKTCPDGSSVRETGPNCQYPACPVTLSTGGLSTLSTGSSKSASALDQITSDLDYDTAVSIAQNAGLEVIEYSPDGDGQMAVFLDPDTNEEVGYFYSEEVVTISGLPLPLSSNNKQLQICFSSASEDWHFLVQADGTVLDNYMPGPYTVSSVNIVNSSSDPSNRVSFEGGSYSNSLFATIVNQQISLATSAWNEVGAVQGTPNTPPGNQTNSITVQYSSDEVNAEDPNSLGETICTSNENNDSGTRSCRIELFGKTISDYATEIGLYSNSSVGSLMGWIIEHEIGHALGLGHSKKLNSLMFKTIPGDYQIITKGVPPIASDPGNLAPQLKNYANGEVFVSNCIPATDYFKNPVIGSGSSLQTPTSGINYIIYDSSNCPTPGATVVNGVCTCPNGGAPENGSCEHADVTITPGSACSDDPSAGLPPCSSGGSESGGGGGGGTSNPWCELMSFFGVRCPNDVN